MNSRRTSGVMLSSSKAWTTEGLRTEIVENFGVSPVLTDTHLRVECERGHEFIRDVVAAFPDEIQTVRFGKPTLEDVFIKLTGNPFL